MSPKDKGRLAHEHLHVAQAAIEEGRLNEAVNALFYAAEAARSLWKRRRRENERSAAFRAAI
jgi:hypothetical protein